MAAPNGLIVAWPSTVVSIPGGWSRYAALDSKVPKPSAAGIGTTGGADTHTHSTTSHKHDDKHGHSTSNDSQVTADTVVDGGSSGSSFANSAHVHTYTLAPLSLVIDTSSQSGTSDSGSSLGFANYSVIWIQSDGTTDIPTNALAWSGQGSVPAGWSAHAASVGYFLRGSAAGAGGGTPTAAAGHSHTFSHLHQSTGSHSHTVTNVTSGASQNRAAGASTSVDVPGPHTATSASATTSHATGTGTDASSSDSKTPEPAFYKLQHVQASGAAAAPPGLIALWPNTTPPAGWSACDGTKGTPAINGSGQFIKGANGTGQIGDLGGSNSHDHVDPGHPHTGITIGGHSAGTFAAGHANPAQVASGGATTVNHTHTHVWGDSGNGDGTSTSTDSFSYTSSDNQPAYVQMHFIMADVPQVVSVTGMVAIALARGIAHNPPAAPTGISDAQINDALGGCDGPVVIRHRFEWWRDFVSIQDVSTAVESAQIQLDNNRAVTRTAQFTLRPERLPATDFSTEHNHIAAFAELNVGGTWVRFPLGVFHLDSTTERILPNHQEVWEASAMDVAGHLWEHEFSEPYTVPAGTNYVEAAEAICRLIGLPTDIFPTAFVTPSAFTWPSGTAYGAVVNDLLLGINYYPIWASSSGLLRSRERLDPFFETPAVTYTTEEVPRLIRSPFSRLRESGRYINRALVTVGDPARTALSMRVTNDDSDSIVSTVNKGAITVQNQTGDRIVNTTMMGEVGASIVRDAAVKAQGASLKTHPDPRRDAHEFYTITIDNREEATPWRAESWTYSCETGKDMDHRIGRAERVDVTVELIVTTAAPPPGDTTPPESHWEPQPQPPEDRRPPPP